jgi:glycosyltransferase involved in cell wall biosynthesis
MLEQLEQNACDLRGKRVLVFIVAYNAETTIEKVLARIPQSLHTDNVEVLIIDDSSKDETFTRGLRGQEKSVFKTTVLRTPENQGYGGNQKLGYRYAIDNGFDIVALLHGDGQYAPEKVPTLLEPLLSGEADAVFGSRMLEKHAARSGGMPRYKWLGNKVLTAFQNRVLGTAFSEFHSGYRLYSTEALSQIPFERNTDDFHFDTEIIIQLVLRGLRVAELPIPVFYGDEICYVNGMRYAWNVFKTTLRARFHQMNLLFDRKYEVDSQDYQLKLGFLSSHTLAITAAQPGNRILDVGCGSGYVARELARKGCRPTGLDRYVPEASLISDSVEFIRWDLDRAEFPVNISDFEQILMLDIIEHLRKPEAFMDQLRSAAVCKRPEVIITTANIGFFVTRFMLFFGQFNYGKKGILDATHTRLFTFRTLIDLLKQSGYNIFEVRGIPAPFPLAIGNNFISRFLLRVNQALLHVSKGLFSYQIFVRAVAKPTVDNLLVETIETSAELLRTALVD